MARLGWIGVDYGAKTAGTTALCARVDGRFVLEQSRKGSDADAWLRDRLDRMRPDSVYIDAPLSLPPALLGHEGDHFFRRADRALGAMSPMFLGGLTARAIRLRDEHPYIAFHETYPSALATALKMPGRKETLVDRFHVLEQVAGLDLPTPTSAHQLDAILAWLSGRRHRNGGASVYGSEDEGQVVV